ncbi:M48 family metallopeptidase [Actinomadura logoneensis]|uniref:M48 family metallopeptidase n=1 Tax=Actinomadura logoneensis TaxID=2293572 RepID=UPI0011C16977|nr:M48 family metallopeptidase [Actinomadura logoneensis]
MSSPRRPGTALIGLRALLGVGLLLGFYLLVAILMVLVTGTMIALAVLVQAVFHQAGNFFLWLMLGASGGGAAMLRGAFGRMRSNRDAEPGGLRVTEADQPRLWAEVRALADEVRAPVPRVIRVVPDANAAVHQRVWLFGLIRGRVTLVVGAALFATLDRAELRAVLAHEFGHVSGGDTRLGPLVYRSQRRLERTVAALQGSDKALDAQLARVIGVYLRLCMRVTLAVSRSQERAADRSAARVAGPEALASALTAISAQSVLFQRFTVGFAVPLWKAGRYPTDLYGGLRAFIAEPCQREEAEKLREAALARPTGRWDSHPSLGERLALLAELPSAGPSGLPTAEAGLRRGAGSARDLLDRPDDLERVLSLEIAREITGLADPVPTDWDAAAEVYAAEVVGRAARAMTDAAVRVGGRWDVPGFDQALELLAAGRGHELVSVSAPGADAPGDRDPQVVRRRLERVLAFVFMTVLAAEHGGVWKTSWEARFELEWSGTPVGELVDRALDGPDGVAAVRAELGRPAVDLTPVPPLEEPVHAG